MAVGAMAMAKVAAAAVRAAVAAAVRAWLGCQSRPRDGGGLPPLLVL